MERLLLLFAFIGVLTPTDSSVLNSTSGSIVNATTKIPEKRFLKQKLECSSDEEPVQNLPCVAICGEPFPQYCFFDLHYREVQCKCKNGYVRRSYKERQCIPREKCPTEEFLPGKYPPQSNKCGIDEEPVGNDGPCISTCAEPNVKVCPFVRTHREEHCKCRDGYVRLSHVQRECVPKEDCSRYWGA